ncbi:hypothetical protein DFS34DRAFT_604632 [Phlyctochytrium arcticum]|nr:hypothetical protein DFS34DRAFT_604632 [Phlyctochytrium arcticum]
MTIKFWNRSSRQKAKSPFHGKGSNDGSSTGSTTDDQRSSISTTAYDYDHDYDYYHSAYDEGETAIDDLTLTRIIAAYDRSSAAILNKPKYSTALQTHIAANPTTGGSVDPNNPTNRLQRRHTTLKVDHGDKWWAAMGGSRLSTFPRSVVARGVIEAALGEELTPIKQNTCPLPEIISSRPLVRSPEPADIAEDGIPLDQERLEVMLPIEPSVAMGQPDSDVSPQQWTDVVPKREKPVSMGFVNPLPSPPMSPRIVSTESQSPSGPAKGDEKHWSNLEYPLDSSPAHIPSPNQTSYPPPLFNPPPPPLSEPPQPPWGCFAPTPPIYDDSPVQETFISSASSSPLPLPPRSEWVPLHPKPPPVVRLLRRVSTWLFTAQDKAACGTPSSKPKSKSPMFPGPAKDRKKSLKAPKSPWKERGRAMQRNLSVAKHTGEPGRVGRSKSESAAGTVKADESRRINTYPPLPAVPAQHAKYDFEDDEDESEKKVPDKAVGPASNTALFDSLTRSSTRGRSTHTSESKPIASTRRSKSATPTPTLPSWASPSSHPPLPPVFTLRPKPQLTRKQGAVLQPGHPSTVRRLQDAGFGLRPVAAQRDATESQMSVRTDVPGKSSSAQVGRLPTPPTSTRSNSTLKRRSTVRRASTSTARTTTCKSGDISTTLPSTQTTEDITKQTVSRADPNWQPSTAQDLCNDFMSPLRMSLLPPPRAPSSPPKHHVHHPTTPPTTPTPPATDQDLVPEMEMPPPVPVIPEQFRRVSGTDLGRQRVMKTGHAKAASEGGIWIGGGMVQFPGPLTRQLTRSAYLDGVPDPVMVKTQHLNVERTVTISGTYPHHYHQRASISKLPAPSSLTPRTTPSPTQTSHSAPITAAILTGDPLPSKAESTQTPLVPYPRPHWESHRQAVVLTTSIPVVHQAFTTTSGSVIQHLLPKSTPKHIPAPPPRRSCTSQELHWISQRSALRQKLQSAQLSTSSNLAPIRQRAQQA